MPELSVIIATLEPRRDIDAIRHLDRDDYPDYELIVRDDSSVTTARNEGIERASADKLVFLDDDSRPAPGYLERISTLLDDEAVVTGRTVHPRDDVFDRIAGHYDFGDAPRYVTRFWGCNAGARAEVFDAVGGWDEEMGWGHEEKELAERVLREFPIYYDPDLVVEHPYADSLLDYWRKTYRLEAKTPYYWDKTGVSEQQQWIRIGQTALNPTNYAGVSAVHAVARIGGTVAATLGRIRGMTRKDT